MSAQSTHGLTMNDVWEYYGPSMKKEFEDRFYLGHQRPGQAFMNALFARGHIRDYHTVANSLKDPFYKEDIEAVLAAFEYILERK